MKVLKYIFGRFSRLKIKISKKVLRPTDIIPKVVEAANISPKPELENEIFFNEDIIVNEKVDELIEQLSFVHNKTEYQDEKRREAYEKLAGMEQSAKKAIPVLIEKKFNNFQWERSLAANTLSKIGKEWYLESICHEKIDYLIKKLLKDKPDSSLAFGILSRIGLPAEFAVLEKLRHDKQIIYIQFLKHQKNTSKEFLKILGEIFSDSGNSYLWEVALESLCNFDEISVEIESKMDALISNENPSIRLAAINSIDKLIIKDKSFIGIDDFLAASLCQRLSDDFARVISSAIDVLSKINNQLAEEFYVYVLKGKGKFKYDNWEEYFKKIEPILHRGETGHWRIREDQYRNNKFWTAYELKKVEERPFILLGSVLKILFKRTQLNNIKYIGKLTIEVLVSFENKDEQLYNEIIENAIKLLGEIPGEKNEIIQVLLNWLDHPNKHVRVAAACSLNKLDKEWLKLNDSALAISRIIDNLDHYHKKENSKAILTELGPKVIPLINENLSATRRRIVLRSLIEILNSFIEQDIDTLPILIELLNKDSNTDVKLEINDWINKFGETSLSETSKDNQTILDKMKRLLKKFLNCSTETKSTKYHNYKYDITVSFASEDRSYVEETVKIVKSEGYTVFYDKDETVNLWGKDLYQYLSDIYKNRAKFCVIFISKSYVEKLWTRHELRNAQERAFSECCEYILPVRFDNSELPGLNNTIGYIDLKTIDPGRLANIIIEKLK